MEESIGVPILPRVSDPGFLSESIDVPLVVLVFGCLVTPAVRTDVHAVLHTSHRHRRLCRPPYHHTPSIRAVLHTKLPHHHSPPIHTISPQSPTRCPQCPYSPPIDFALSAVLHPAPLNCLPHCPALVSRHISPAFLALFPPPLPRFLPHHCLRGRSFLPLFLPCQH